MTSANTNQQPATIQAWLTQRGVTGFAKHHVACALGVSSSEVDAYLAAAPTAEALLNLNHLVQLKHLTLAKRVWPNCTWLAWENYQRDDPPVIDLIRRVFGRELLDHVKETFGEDIVLRYWRSFDLPLEYEDIQLDDEDPFEGVPDEQIVENPHLNEEEEVGESFIFGTAETAACFRWLIERRSQYSHFVDTRTGYTNDPAGVQLAYDLRHVLKEEYCAPLPPDTLPAYLAIVHALLWVTVPEEWEEGRLSPLYISEVATLPTDRLEVVQSDDHKIWLWEPDALDFEQQPVHVFALEADTGEAPAALILTTHAEPGNPERHRENPPLRQLRRSTDTILLAFVPRDIAADVKHDIGEYEDVIFDALCDLNYGMAADTGIFCVFRANLGMDRNPTEPVPVYRIPGGYMLQFNPAYSFAPDEMAVE